MGKGPLAMWHCHALRQAGFPVICLHARYAYAAPSFQLNKTDRNARLQHVIPTTLVQNKFLKCLRLVSSNCLRCQGHSTSFVLQGVRCFTIALRMVSSFRMQAVRATFLAFPDAQRR